MSDFHSDGFIFPPEQIFFLRLPTRKPKLCAFLFISKKFRVCNGWSRFGRYYSDNYTNIHKTCLLCLRLFESGYKVFCGKCILCHLQESICVNSININCMYEVCDWFSNHGIKVFRIICFFLTCNVYFVSSKTKIFIYFYNPSQHNYNTFCTTKNIVYNTQFQFPAQIEHYSIDDDEMIDRILLLKETWMKFIEVVCSSPLLYFK